MDNSRQIDRIYHWKRGGTTFYRHRAHNSNDNHPPPFAKTLLYETMVTTRYDTLGLVRLAKLQDKFYSVRDYTMGNSRKVSSVFRSQILDWYVSVAEYCELDQNIAVIAINYFDRAIANISSRRLANEDQVLRIGATCIYLAQKVHGMQTHVALPPGFVCRLCKKSAPFTIPMLHEYEQIVLQSIQWHVNPTTCYDFLEYFAPRSSYLKSKAHDLLQLALHDLGICQYGAAVVTLAALFCASANYGAGIEVIEKWKGVFGISDDDWKDCTLLLQCKLDLQKIDSTRSPKSVTHIN